MKKIMISMIMVCAFGAHFMYASSISSVASSTAHAAVTSVATSTVSLVSSVCQMIQNNPHLMVGVGLFMSRPLLGLVIQAEEYSLARLAGLVVTSSQNNLQATVNVGALALQAVTLTNDQVQECGMLSVNVALQEVQDPATSGSAYAISLKNAKKDDSANQSNAQDFENTFVEAVVNQVVSQGLQDALAGNISNPALVQGLEDTFEGNAVWGLNVSANIGNYGLQGTIGVSDTVLAILGALAVAGLQASGSALSSAQATASSTQAFAPSSSALSSSLVQLPAK